MRTFATLMLCALLSLGLSGCVSQRTVDGKDQPAQQFDANEAARTRLALGLQYLRAGNFTQARANLERARDFAPRMPEIYTGLAFYFQQVQEYGQAEQNYRYALRLKPDDGDTLNNLGVLLCSQSRPDEADELFNKAIAQTNYVRVADTYENAALCAADHNRYKSAENYYKLALNHSPNNVEILESYARMLLKLRRFSDTEVVLARRAAQPRLTAEYLWLEVQLAEAQRKPAKRAQFAELLQARFPTSGQAQQVKDENYE